MTNQEIDACCTPVIRHLHSWCCNEQTPSNPQSQYKVFYDASGVDGPNLDKPNGIALDETVILPDDIQDYKWFRFGYYIKTDHDMERNPGILLSRWISPIGTVFSDTTIYADPAVAAEASSANCANLQTRLNFEEKSMIFNQRCWFRINRIDKTITNIPNGIDYTVLYRLEAAHFLG